MENSWYSVEVSTGWLMLALLMSALLSFILYSKKNLPWSRNVSFFLGFFRFASLFLTAALLLNPFVNFSQNFAEKPKVVIALDDSKSLAYRMSQNQLSEVEDWILEAKEVMVDFGYEVELKSLGSSNDDSISFTNESTNLAKLLSDIEEINDGSNLTAVVVLSDGIVNEGRLPQYQPYTFPVFTLGLGDTIPPVDLAIQNVQHNKMVFQGNQFPVRLEVYQQGFAGQSVTVFIKEGNKILTQKSLSLVRPTEMLDLTLLADKPGLRHLVAEVKRLDGEVIIENNTYDFYIQVIEGKERILILADAPHPDIAAIRSALNASENYETEVQIPGLTKELKNPSFDLVIVHGAFSKARLPDYPNVTKWYILGDHSSYVRAASELPFFKFRALDKQKDRVRPALAGTFSKFQLKAEKRSHIKDYPPLSIPFADYQVSGPTEMFLTQQVGSVTTEKPFMFFFDDGTTKAAMTLASGLWTWRLQESGLYGKAELFDELVLKTVQYLSLRSDKKHFSVKPRHSTFSENEQIWMDTEVYDAVFERMYGNQITIQIKDEKGLSRDYEFTDNTSYSSFQLGTLTAGVYSFTAEVEILGKKLKESGEFLVKKAQLEAVELTANHQLLRQLSTESGGQFYSLQESEALVDVLKAANFKPMIHTRERILPAIQMMWLLGLLFIFLSIEGFLRKYLGAY